MSKKSPLVSAISVLAGIVIFAGGAAKLYRGISQLNGGTDPKVTELLKQNDAAIEEANKTLAHALPEFQQLLNDFDTLGVAAFRTEKKDVCNHVIEDFNGASSQLQVATNAIGEALKIDGDSKVAEFLKTRATSYEKLVSVCQQNIEIIKATTDESTTDTDAIVAKVMSIAETRDALQKEADEATAAADALLASATK